MNPQQNQGCNITDFLGKPHLFLKCKNCIHVEKDCRPLRNEKNLILSYTDEPFKNKLQMTIA
jgi:hypothetical protein